ncbi:multiple coagulation factor deficiency protein 2 homolog [Lineus longissimus]|uniref:multiple coagulation factor deficiency protein 2 homolog n=1 Tax=Lineus longissimus TaxID=88925 RepID=UPI002B4D2DA7
MDRSALTPIFLATLAVVLLGRSCFGDEHAHQLGNMADIKDTEHMQKHLDEEGVKANAKDMSVDEEIFYYFTLHDFDNSSTIDGLEIYQARLHTLAADEKAEINQTFKDKAAADVDSTLKKYDQNNDGHLDYVEYKIIYNIPTE